MMTKYTLVALLFVQATTTLAVAVSGTIPGLFTRANDVLSSHYLQSRQTNIDTPAECRSICDPVLETVNTCTVTTCCTSTFTGSYANCAICVGRVANITDYSTLQSAIHQLVTKCAQSGFPVNEPTLPGQPVPSQQSGVGSSTTGSTSSSSTSLPATTTRQQVTITNPADVPTSSTVSQQTLTLGPGGETGSPNAPSGLGNSAPALGYSWKAALAIVALSIGAVLQ